MDHESKQIKQNTAIFKAFVLIHPWIGAIFNGPPSNGPRIWVTYPYLMDHKPSNTFVEKAVEY